LLLREGPGSTGVNQQQTRKYMNWQEFYSHILQS
jgi:hypothetical protein